MGGTRDPTLGFILVKAGAWQLNQPPGSLNFLFVSRSALVLILKSNLPGIYTTLFNKNSSHYF